MNRRGARRIPLAVVSGQHHAGAAAAVGEAIVMYRNAGGAVDQHTDAEPVNLDTSDFDVTRIGDLQPW